MLPGMNVDQVKEIIPEIVIGEDEPINSEGWNFPPEIETKPQMLERIKFVIKDLKEMHR